MPNPETVIGSTSQEYENEKVEDTQLEEADSIVTPLPTEPSSIIYTQGE